MLSKPTLFVTFAYALAAVAAPGGSTGGVCNSGPAQCCESVQSTANNAGLRDVLKQLGVSVSDVAINVGLNCSPLSVIGVGGNNCNSQPLCCELNNFNGLVAVNCSPINVDI